MWDLLYLIIEYIPRYYSYPAQTPCAVCIFLKQFPSNRFPLRLNPTACPPQNHPHPLIVQLLHAASRGRGSVPIIFSVVVGLAEPLVLGRCSCIWIRFDSRAESLDLHQTPLYPPRVISHQKKKKEKTRDCRVSHGRL